jgi:hypothetical protein
LAAPRYFLGGFSAYRGASLQDGAQCHRLGANFAVSEVVGVTQSIHALIRKSDFAGK